MKKKKMEETEYRIILLRILAKKNIHLPHTRRVKEIMRKSTLFAHLTSPFNKKQKKMKKKNIFRHTDNSFISLG